MTRPRLLILDEPTEGIQPSIIKDIGRAIATIRDGGGGDGGGNGGGVAIVLVEEFFEFAWDWPTGSSCSSAVPSRCRAAAREMGAREAARLVAI